MDVRGSLSYFLKISWYFIFSKDKKNYIRIASKLKVSNGRNLIQTRLQKNTWQSTKFYILFLFMLVTAYFVIMIFMRYKDKNIIKIYTICNQRVTSKIQFEINWHRGARIGEAGW